MISKSLDQISKFLRGFFLRVPEDRDSAIGSREGSIPSHAITATRSVDELVLICHRISSGHYHSIECLRCKKSFEDSEEIINQLWLSLPSDPHFCDDQLPASGVWN